MLPTDIVGATYFPVTARALSIAYVMIISKTIATNYFKGTLRKES
jgi:hypothetical protein